MKPSLLLLLTALQVLTLGMTDVSAEPGKTSSSQLAAPTRLRCDYRSDPLGIDSTAPRLDWIVSATAPSSRAVTQSAYQILVASAPDLLAADAGDLWDSGKVTSNETNQISYGGKPLVSAQNVVWKVRVWDGKDQASPWSEPAHWTMGLLTDADWKGAKWIGSPFAASLGFHAAIGRKANEVKWVQIDLGESRLLSAIRLHPVRHADKDGFGFPVRFTVETSNDPEFRSATVVVNHATDLPNPGLKAVAIDGLKGASARYVRVTARAMPEERKGEFCFALRQIEVMSEGKNAALGCPVSAQDSVEKFGWGKAGLTDGVWESSRADVPAALAFTPNGTTRLRRDISIKPGLKRAVLFVCGLGQQEIDLDGAKVGIDLLEPGYSDYVKTCFYSTHDVTAQLRPGASHRLEILLGNGFYNVQAAPGRYTKFTRSFGPRQGIALVRLEYENGEVDQVVTDENWTMAPGATTFANVYAGEDEDARLSLKDTGPEWRPVTLLPVPGGTLLGVSKAAPPVRVDETFKPVSIRELKPGVSIYDFGQNATMMPRLLATGPAGSIVRMIPSEVLKPDGSVDRQTCTQDGVRPAWWQLTLAGRGDESWFPKFFCHGARYLQVELVPATPGGESPVVKSLESCAVHSSSADVGEFSCSSELFNQTFRLVRWAQQNNMGTILTDCPHRERLGWLEEEHLNGPSLRYDFDLNALFTKAMRDMADGQLSDGLVPNFVPEYTRLGGAFRDSTAWGSSFILVAWQQYEFSGDIRLLSDYYEPMKRYFGHLQSKAKDNIIREGLGDWFDIGPKAPWLPQLTPIANTDTCFYFYDAQIMGRIATILGKDGDARQFAALAEDIRRSFNQKFFRSDKGWYSTGSQASNCIPCAMGMVDPENRAAVFQAILEDLAKHQNSFTTGEVAYRYLLRALADGGRSDLVFTMNNQSDKPGYGMQIKKGCTSLTERWDGGTTGWSSQDHFMSGQIVEWFYHDLVGIQRDDSVPAFKKIVIKPAIVGDLTWAKGSYDSIQGKIASEWKREGQRLTLHVTIPANTTATIYVPSRDVASVNESGLPATQAVGVKSMGMEGTCAVFAVGSGDYTFGSILP